MTNVDELREDIDRLRGLLDRTDAVLAVSDEALAHADEVVRAARRWVPLVVAVGGAVAVLAAVLIKRKRTAEDNWRDA